MPETLRCGNEAEQRSGALNAPVAKLGSPGSALRCSATHVSASACTTAQAQQIKGYKSKRSRSSALRTKSGSRKPDAAMQKLTH